MTHSIRVTKLHFTVPQHTTNF